MSLTRIYVLLRHGEVEGGPQYRGTKDDPLTPNGCVQMMEAIQFITERYRHSIRAIYTSPLKRCHHFAAKFSQSLERPLHVEEALKEIDFGQWEGKTSEELYQQDPELLTAFWQAPERHTPPNGEPLAVFAERVKGAWSSIINSSSESMYKDWPTFEVHLLIAHGGVQKIILSDVLSMPLSSIHAIDVPHACLSAIQIHYNGDSISSKHLVFHGSAA